MSARTPHWLIRHRKDDRDYWLLDFRAANGRFIVFGQVYRTRKAVTRAIELVDPAGVHPVVEA